MQYIDPTQAAVYVERIRQSVFAAFAYRISRHQGGGGLRQKDGGRVIRIRDVDEGV
jgi:hypothetical protein